MDVIAFEARHDARISIRDLAHGSLGGDAKRERPASANLDNAVPRRAHGLVRRAASRFVAHASLSR